MFVIVTQESPAGPPSSVVPHRIAAYRDGTLHVAVPYDSDRDPAFNHRNAALISLKKSGNGFTQHHVLGAAPVPGHDFWVVAVEEEPEP